jgi:hypothetical protein
VKTSLRDLTITASPDALNALRSVLDDLLSVTNAARAVLKEGMVEQGQFNVQATLA